MDNKIIAVDFDGTLCENKYPEIVNCPHCGRMYSTNKSPNGKREVTAHENSRI